MKEENRKKFSLLMRRLRVTFPINLNDKDEALRGEVYWEEFKATPIEGFELAVNEAIKSLSFFPKPIELHEFIWKRNEIEYRQKRSDDHLIEYKEQEDFISSERAKEILSEIQKIISPKEKLKPFLEGLEAKEFEEKRKKAKEKVKLLKT